MRLAGPVATTPQALPVTRPVAEPLAATPQSVAVERPLFWRIPFPILPASLPMASTRSGNLFADRNNPNLHWYLPQFAPAADVDPAFVFAASQTSQQIPMQIGIVSIRK